MKLIQTGMKTMKALAAALFMLVTMNASAQISIVCTNPTTTIYGLTGNGEIYPINVTNATVGTAVKNNSYPVRSASRANGMGFNRFNNTFYYFKRNYGTSPMEFVSFNPALNLVTVLASSSITDETHTGCVSFNGAGYYTIDVQGTLHYYNIATNSWTRITSRLVDQNGNNVTNIIQSQDAGDMAIDGLGNIWILTSNDNNYGLYRIPAPMPTTAVAQVNVIRVISPTANTPTGNSFAGIAFSPSGVMYLSTRADNRLYSMSTPTSPLTYIGTFNRNEVGNDLTSCSFPTRVLPVEWKSFDVSVTNGNVVSLNWEVEEENNKGFHVQHSIDGTNWEDIAFVAAKDASKTSTPYTYSHTNNLNGKQHYRLKQEDMDGRFSYSEVRTVILRNSRENITVWPNPATDQIRIVNNSGNSNLVKAQIFDLSGKMYSEKKLQGASISLAITELPRGAYVLRVESSNGTNYNQKFIKQ